MLFRRFRPKTAFGDSPIKGRVSNQPCLCYNYKVMKKISQKCSKIPLVTALNLVIILTGFFVNRPIVLAAPDAGVNEDNIWRSRVAPLPAKETQILAAFNDGLKIVIRGSVVATSAEMEIARLDRLADLPWQLGLASPIYQIDLKDKSVIAPGQALAIQIRSTANLDKHRQIFLYDRNKSAWLPLKSKLQANGLVEADLPFSFSQLAVLAYPEIPVAGKASWYNYKKGLYAASPDFPKGSRLRVFNLANNKFVDVEINDYGPDRVRHPDRVVDLEKTAFRKIASTGEGIINVRLEPLIVKPKDGKILGIDNAGATHEPRLASKSSVVLDENTGTPLWMKNATTSLPIASLTKLVAIKVFLDTRPSLDRVVAYNRADEELNNRYAEAWQIARLKVKEGETMTIADLLYASLVGSANNSVESLVRVSGLSRDDFIAKMNQFAREAGASSTNFVEPTGLAPENVSSPFDYAIIIGRVLENPIIEKASTLPVYNFTTKNTKKKHTIKNTNPLIGNGRYSVTGSKTGYLDEAGYCLATRAKRAGRSLIVVTLGAPDRQSSLEDTDQLINYGFRLTR